MKKYLYYNKSIVIQYTCQLKEKAIRTRSSVVPLAAQ
jgi:hypothetical protein